MSWGYYDGDLYDADEDEEFEPQPPQRQRNTPQTPGLRQAMKAMKSEIAALKKERDEAKAMAEELMEGEDPQQQPQAGGYQQPRSPRLGPEEIMQMQRWQEQGLMAAPNQGSQQEQISRIQNAKSPEDLAQYMASQGNPYMSSYFGQGY